MDHIIHISAGAITNKSVLKKAFTGLKDGRYLVSIKKKNNRSLSQNAFYHGCVVPLVLDGLKDAGYDVRTNEDAHEVIKYLFLKKKIANEHGEFIELCGSTATLSTVEFMELIQSVQQWAAEYLNIQIPNPNEQLTIL